MKIVHTTRYAAAAVFLGLVALSGAAQAQDAQGKMQSNQTPTATNTAPAMGGSMNGGAMTSDSMSAGHMAGDMSGKPMTAKQKMAAEKKMKADKMAMAKHDAMMKKDAMKNGSSDMKPSGGM